MPEPFGSLSPFDPLAQLRAANVTLEDSGTTKIGDAKVRHYRGPARVPFTPPSSANLPPTTLTLTFDLYVDSNNRLVRWVQITKQPGVATEVTSQLDFSDYGIDVNVTAPPPDQVLRESDLPPGTLDPTVGVDDVEGTDQCWDPCD